MYRCIVEEMSIVGIKCQITNSKSQISTKHQFSNDQNIRQLNEFGKIIEELFFVSDIGIWNL
jgi:hypothetical protein